MDIIRLSCVIYDQLYSSANLFQSIMRRLNWLVLQGRRVESKGMRGHPKWVTERKGPDDAPHQRGMWKENRSPQGFLCKAKQTAGKEVISGGFPLDNSSKFSRRQSQEDDDDACNLLQWVLEEFH